MDNQNINLNFFIQGLSKKLLKSSSYPLYLLIKILMKFMFYALGLQFKMRTMIEKHIQETIIHRLPDLTEIPEEMCAELSTGFDGSGNNFTVIDFHALHN